MLLQLKLFLFKKCETAYLSVNIYQVILQYSSVKEMKNKLILLQVNLLFFTSQLLPDQFFTVMYMVFSNCSENVLFPTFKNVFFSKCHVPNFNEILQIILINFLIAMLMRLKQF